MRRLSTNINESVVFFPTHFLVSLTMTLRAPMNGDRAFIQIKSKRSLFMHSADVRG